MALAAQGSSFPRLISTVPKGNYPFFLSVSVPNILILGHSFVRRLKDDLAARFDARAAPNVHLPESGHVSLYGTGGRTVDKIHAYDLSLVLKYKPDIVILELGTNDLSTLRPEVVGSKIDDLAQVLRDQYKVRVIGVCQVVNRNIPHTRSPDCDFNAKAAVLRQYLSVILADQHNIFLWEHKEFYRSDRTLLSLDGVHCNAQGQYCLYRSYRGAILKALTML